MIFLNSMYFVVYFFLFFVIFLGNWFSFEYNIAINVNRFFWNALSTEWFHQTYNNMLSCSSTDDNCGYIRSEVWMLKMYSKMFCAEYNKRL